MEEEILPPITLLDEADALLKSFKEEVDKKKKSGGTLRHWKSTRKKILIINKKILQLLCILVSKYSFTKIEQITLTPVNEVGFKVQSK